MPQGSPWFRGFDPHRISASRPLSGSQLLPCPGGFLGGSFCGLRFFCLVGSLLGASFRSVEQGFLGGWFFGFFGSPGSLLVWFIFCFVSSGFGVFFRFEIGSWFLFSPAGFLGFPPCVDEGS